MNRDGLILAIFLLIFWILFSLQAGSAESKISYPDLYPPITLWPGTIYEVTIPGIVLEG